MQIMVTLRQIVSHRNVCVMRMRRDSPLTSKGWNSHLLLIRHRGSRDFRACTAGPTFGNKGNGEFAGQQALTGRGRSQGWGLFGHQLLPSGEHCHGEKTIYKALKTAK